MKEKNVYIYICVCVCVCVKQNHSAVWQKLIQHYKSTIFQLKK